MEHGRLIEMGQLTTIDSDGTKTEYKRALVIESVQAIALEHRLTERWVYDILGRSNEDDAQLALF